jgi:thiol-disulfide isomerase/thioredoxin
MIDFLKAQVGRALILTLLGSLLGIVYNQTLSSPRVSYLDFSRLGQLEHLADSSPKVKLPTPTPTSTPVPGTTSPIPISATATFDFSSGIGPVVSATSNKLIVYVFYTGTCKDCKHFMQNKLPQLQKIYKDYAEFMIFDSDKIKYLDLLYKYRKKFEVPKEAEGTLKLFFGSRFIVGVEDAFKKAENDIGMTILEQGDE